ncbi:MAG: ADP-ribosylglycohydrolase family protein [Gemmataceae bacterium]
MIDRRRGCFMGLAVGDALGAAVEFRPPGGFKPVTGYRAGGPHGLEAGEWTDDTSMALALADSIASVGWDLDDQARRYLRWWRQGEYSVNGTCFDIGTTTIRGLARFEQTGDARHSGATGPDAIGNGSIMRLAPVPVAFPELFHKSPLVAAGLCADSSLPTHGHADCVSACAYLGMVMGCLLAGIPRHQVLSPEWPHLASLRAAGMLTPGVELVALGSFRGRHPPEIRGSGRVLQSLEAALWAFWNATSFGEAVLNAVNLGDDADTTGAICGQIAGACWGESGIPREMLDGLVRKHELEVALSRLVSL